MINLYDDIINELNTINKIIISQPLDKKDINKIELHPVLLKDQIYLQSQHIQNNKAYHKNYNLQELHDYINQIIKKYKQVLIKKQGQDISYFINPNGGIKRKMSKNNIEKVEIQGHNKEKNYILQEGEKIPALIDLGVFSKDYKIINSKHDKFKQINKFIEIINDAFKNYDKTEITILDFGCGKSYLTFILYYYFTFKLKINAKIIGYDLKQDVVDNCNQIAKKYGYDNLIFKVSDITKEKENFENVDMIVTLHACDIATDYALYYAIKYGIKNIFSVPCCQHQINKSIGKGGDFDILLQDGLIKERFSALLPDAIRINLLREFGYLVDAIEFVDFAHSPKNLMIRAKKIDKKVKPDLTKVESLIKQYKLQQELYILLQKNI